MIKTKTKVWQVSSEDELPALAQEVLEILGEAKPMEAAAVLALNGDLGAGKTTFMQTLARELGIEERVVSPTFVIAKNYRLPAASQLGVSKLVHIDAYRLDEIDELRVLGFVELLAEKDTMIGIEWAERVATLLPPHTLHLDFEIIGNARKITLTNPHE